MPMIKISAIAIVPLFNILFVALAEERPPCCATGPTQEKTTRSNNYTTYEIHRFVPL